MVFFTTVNLANDRPSLIFTDREFEIIILIREGMDSQTIAEKLFISPHTVDTHRRNILKKTGKASTSELIIDLQDRGFFKKKGKINISY